MNFSLLTIPPAEARSDLLIVPCDEDGLAGDTNLAALDALLAGSLQHAVRAERFRGAAGQTLCLHTQGKLPATHVALLGMGAAKDFLATPAPALLALGGRTARLASGMGAARVALMAPTPLAKSTASAARAVQLLTQGILLGGYRFEKYLAEKKRQPSTLISADLLLTSALAPTETTRAIRRAESVAAAVARARDLVNEPAGTMTPSQLAAVARDIASRHGMQITVLGPKECAGAGMGLFLAVAQGSAEEPRFIHMAWKPSGAKKRIVLVGKGITFDSGGLSLKTNEGMLDMKTDMAGAASVISVMSAIAEQGLPIEVHALAACAENMPSGRAYKLGDVLRSKAGTTVEINNTDAEGRLTLADAITYGLGLSPAAIFDFATLTGACVVALGPHTAGVMSNNDPLCKQWLAAAREAGEDMWRLPLPDRLIDQLKSDVADMKNTGERWGGALTAGLFLKEFVGDVPWVHVDLAGPSATDKEFGHLAKGGTGFAVSTIFEYLRQISAS